MKRSSARAPYRLILLGVIVLLGTATFLYLRGPGFWQRRYYPLEYREAIAESSARHEVNPYLIAAVIDAESGWDPQAESKARAVGLMQVQSRSAGDLERWGIVDGERFPVERLAEPEINIEYGTAYLRYLVERYHEIDVAVAAYNAGLGNVDKWYVKGEDIRDNIRYDETRHYVLRVSRGKDVYARLYPDAFPGWNEEP